jgi:hypothetical protein
MKYSNPVSDYRPTYRCTGRGKKRRAGELGRYTDEN